MQTNQNCLSVQAVVWFGGLLGCLVCCVFSLHAAVSLSCLLFFLPLQALKLTRDVKREPFAKSAVSKWTVILFTAYDLCEPCIIFLTKQTVNRPLTGVKILLFFSSFFFFLFFWELNSFWSMQNLPFLGWPSTCCGDNVQHHPVENTLCSLYNSYLSMSMWCFNILMVYGMF